MTRVGAAAFDDALPVLGLFGPCRLGPCEPDVDGDATEAFGDPLAGLPGWDA